VKDSNLRSSRNGFTDRTTQPADQHERRSQPKIGVHSAQATGASDDDRTVEPKVLLLAFALLKLIAAAAMLAKTMVASSPRRRR